VGLRWGEGRHLAWWISPQTRGRTRPDAKGGETPVASPRTPVVGEASLLQTEQLPHEGLGRASRVQTKPGGAPPRLREGRRHRIQLRLGPRLLRPFGNTSDGGGALEGINGSSGGGGGSRQCRTCTSAGRRCHCSVGGSARLEKAAKERGVVPDAPADAEAESHDHEPARGNDGEELPLVAHRVVGVARQPHLPRRGIQGRQA
jgi:hypothetical protein